MISLLLSSAFAGENLQITQADWTWYGDEYYAIAGSWPVGDVNGDGYADLFVTRNTNALADAIGAVFHGGPDGLENYASWEEFLPGCDQGSETTDGGDINGDGFDDLVVGCWGVDVSDADLTTDEGEVRVYLGSADGVSPTVNWQAYGPVPEGLLGTGVAVGDVNNDGYADLLTTAPLYSGTFVEEGVAYLYLGSAVGLGASPAWTYTGGQAGATLGYGAAWLGDVNGDGYGDIAVSAMYHDNGNTDEGRVLVFHGRATGLRSAPSRIYEGDQDGANLGWGLAGGDFNGDGFGDLAAGAQYHDNGLTDEGRVTMWLGGPTGLPTAASWIAEGNQEGCLYGYGLDALGDLDGDGYDELGVGGRLCSSDGVLVDGVTDVYAGAADGLEDAAAWRGGGGQDGAYFGVTVSGLGDVDGDGYDDFAVGSPYLSDGEVWEGRVELFLGGVLPEIEMFTTDGEGEGGHLALGDAPDPAAADTSDATPRTGCASVPGSVGLIGALAGLLGLAARRRR